MDTFYPFVLSVYGMMIKEAQFVLTILRQIMAKKMDELILQVKGWVNGQIATTVARSYYRVLWGAWVTSTL